MKKIFILCLFVTILLIISPGETSACPRCNEDFKKELLDKRANTLGGQELLEAIKNQSGSNPTVVLPVKYVFNDAPESGTNQQMVTENNTESDSVSNFTLIKIFINVWFSNL